ncbi:hypothetical protein BKA93DRAFT_751165 [Sparassis latifolia]
MEVPLHAGSNSPEEKCIPNGGWCAKKSVRRRDPGVTQARHGSVDVTSETSGNVRSAPGGKRGRCTTLTSGCYPRDGVPTCHCTLLQQSINEHTFLFNAAMGGSTDDSKDSAKEILEEDASKSHISQENADYIRDFIRVYHNRLLVVTRAHVATLVLQRWKAQTGLFKSQLEAAKEDAEDSNLAMSVEQ